MTAAVVVMYRVMQATTFFLSLLLLVQVQGGPYTKKGRETANSSLVSAAQWFLQERLLAVELHVLNMSVDVGRLAEQTTREAYRLSEETNVRVKSLAQSLQKEVQRYRPLVPQCFNKEVYKMEMEKIAAEAEEVYQCTHAVADEGASMEVAVTVQLSDARNHIWNVQEAMYFCEKYNPEVDTSCLKRLTVEGLQVLRRLPDRVAQELDNAQARAAQSRSRLEACYTRGVSKAEEHRLAEAQRMRRCVQNVREGRRDVTTLEVLGRMGKRTL